MLAKTEIGNNGGPDGEFKPAFVPDEPAAGSEAISQQDTETRVLESARERLLELGVSQEELQQLTGFIERYRYNDPDTRLDEIVQRGADIKRVPWRPDEYEVHLPDFFTFDDGTTGQCRELSLKVLRDMTESGWVEKINEQNRLNGKPPIEVRLVAGQGPEEMGFSMHYWLTIAPEGTYEEKYKPRYEKYRADYVEYRTNGGDMPLIPTDGNDGSVAVDASMRYIAPQSVGYDGQPMSATANSPDGLSMEWRMPSSQPGMLRPGTITVGDSAGEHQLNDVRSTIIAYTPDYQLCISLGFATTESGGSDVPVPVIYAGVDADYSAAAYMLDGNVVIRDTQNRLSDAQRQQLTQYATKLGGLQIRSQSQDQAQ